MRIGEADRIRCSAFARANGVDPGGTALAPDVVLVVEVDEPWPKPAARHPDVTGVATALVDRPEHVRLLNAVPRHHDRRRILAFRPTDGGSAMTRTEVDLGDDPRADVRAVLDTRAMDHVSTGGQATTVLLCTQGSHDVCCGTLGAELADWLEGDRADVEVFRVSHTGGHRFAPTAMTLPDGRMWAYLTPESIGGIIDRTADPRLAAGSCRGWWGAPMGAAQIGERAVFERVGWELDGARRLVTVTPTGGGERLVEVDAADEHWKIVVGVGRAVPTIACEAPGGEPVKPGHEWIVHAIERGDDR